MDSFYRSVRLIIRIKNKYRICAIQLHSCCHIHATDTCFQLSFQWMIYHKKIEQQHGKRISVCIFGWVFLSSYNLRSHKSRCTKNSARFAVIKRYVVIIADQYISIIRIEEQVSKRNVLVFGSHSVQLLISSRQIKKSLSPWESDFDFQTVYQKAPSFHLFVLLIYREFSLSLSHSRRQSEF